MLVECSDWIECIRSLRLPLLPPREDVCYHPCNDVFKLASRFYYFQKHSTRGRYCNDRLRHMITCSRATDMSLYARYDLPRASLFRNIVVLGQVLWASQALEMPTLGLAIQQSASLATGRIRQCFMQNTRRSGLAPKVVCKNSRGRPCT